MAGAFIAKLFANAIQEHLNFPAALAQIDIVLFPMGEQFSQVTENKPPGAGAFMESFHTDVAHGYGAAHANDGLRRLSCEILDSNLPRLLIVDITLNTAVMAEGLGVSIQALLADFAGPHALRSLMKRGRPRSEWEVIRRLRWENDYLIRA